MLEAADAAERRERKSLPVKDVSRVEKNQAEVTDYVLPPLEGNPSCETQGLSQRQQWYTRRDSNPGPTD